MMITVSHEEMRKIIDSEVANALADKQKVVESCAALMDRIKIEANYATLRAENERLKGEVERLREALTPSAETKGAYMGEFSMRLPELDEDGNEYSRSVNIPWITIKDIMKAIVARAAIPPRHG